MTHDDSTAHDVAQVGQETLRRLDQRLDEQAEILRRQDVEIATLRERITSTQDAVIVPPELLVDPPLTLMEHPTSRRRALQILAFTGATAGAMMVIPAAVAATDADLLNDQSDGSTLPTPPPLRTEAAPPSTPGVHYFTVPGQSFRPVESATTYTGQDSFGGIRVVTGIGQFLQYNLRVPQGARWVSCDFYYRDTSTSYILFDLSQFDHSIDDRLWVDQGVSTGAASGVRVTTLPWSGPLIDNNAYSYVVRVAFNDAANQQLLGVRVGYRPPVLNVESAGSVASATSTPHAAGDVLRTDDGSLWYAASAGTPGTLRKLAGPTTAGQLHLLPAPVRVYDSRPGNAPIPGGAGSLSNGVRAVDLTNGFVGNVSTPACPRGAAGAIVSVTLDATVGAGFLAVFSNAINDVSSSSLNWSGHGQIVAVTTVTAVDAGASMKVKAGGGGSTQFVVDVIGYYQ
jgi:hypothetical protein